jgi:copper homeostasis protein
MENFTLEVCVDSVESAMAAISGGATRLELCANLVIGGTTPGLSLYHEIRKLSKIPIHVLIRPRFGDFCYTDNELRLIREDIALFGREGAEGVVIGVLQPDGSLDSEAMKPLCNAADGMSITLHRAFDMCRDPFEALRQAEGLGISAILTSGQRNCCLDGAELLGQLVGRCRVDILAGAGVTADAIRQLRAKTGVSSYHLSGKVVVDSNMVYRNPDLSMGLPSMSEYEIWRTSADLIAAARQALEEVE